jgi:hypothetical protein
MKKKKKKKNKPLKALGCRHKKVPDVIEVKYQELDNLRNTDVAWKTRCAVENATSNKD